MMSTTILWYSSKNGSPVLLEGLTGTIGIAFSIANREWRSALACFIGSAGAIADALGSGVLTCISAKAGTLADICGGILTWIKTLLDRMAGQLGLSNEVDRGNDDMRRNQEAAQWQATLTHVDEDGNAVMMAQNANRGFGASSRDANYRDNVSRLVSGGYEKGHCAVANCQHV